MPIDKTNKISYNVGKWYRCPKCRKKLLFIEEETEIRKLHFKCKQCRNIIEINVPEKGI